MHIWLLVLEIDVKQVKEVALMITSHIEICLSSPIQNTKMKARVYVINIDCY
jgi:hypothetical protein